MPFRLRDFHVFLFKIHANFRWFSILQVDSSQRDWLRNSGWDREKQNMILIHGYGGSVDALPMSVLRDGNSFIQP